MPPGSVEGDSGGDGLGMCIVISSISNQRSPDTVTQNLDPTFPLDNVNVFQKAGDGRTVEFTVPFHQLIDSSGNMLRILRKRMVLHTMINV
mmetsp:Transcript_39346/g.102591  ORF Transcript_39346/g.102591 Transcript_39346/m.102591 type:complete len:91 (-) Transcript_39346:713-985(-)